MQEPPRREDALPPRDDDRVATVGDVRSVRRWLAVTAVWAVAATALGVIALLEATKDDGADRRQAAGELGRVQRALNDRIDELESRMDDLASAEDVSKLDRRLGEVEDAADKAATASERLSARVDDLEARVDDLEARTDQLEQAPPAGGTETAP